MNPRNTLLLALVVAALGAFVWFYEIEGATQRSEEEAASKRVFTGVTADQIGWIELRTEDGTNARLERDPEGWKLVAPLAFRADRFAADGVASTLAELQAEATFDSPEPLANYGLEGEPAARFGAGAATHTLRVGNSTPVGGNIYVTDADGKKVFAVASWRSNALKKSVKQLREARVVDFDRAKLNGLVLESGDGRVVLAKAAGGWAIAEPMAAKADADAVEGLISDLQYLRADEFVDAPASEAELGLAAPWLVLELKLEGEEAPRRVAVGGVRGDKRVVRGAAGPVFEIASSRLDALPRKLSAFRFKELARFPGDDAARFELRFQPAEGEPLTITGTNDAEQGWSTAPEAMQPGKASRLVSDLSELRAEEVMADALGDAERAALGLAPPRVKLAVFGKPGKPAPGAGAQRAEGERSSDGVDMPEEPALAEVWLGDRDPARGIPAMRGGEPVVYWLGPTASEGLPISLAAWRESFLAKEEAKPAEGDAPAASAEPGAAAPAEPEAEAEAPATE
jgi:hypothetical protein